MTISRRSPPTLDFFSCLSGDQICNEVLKEAVCSVRRQEPILPVSLFSGDFRPRLRTGLQPLMEVLTSDPAGLCLDATC